MILELMSSEEALSVRLMIDTGLKNNNDRARLILTAAAAASLVLYGWLTRISTTPWAHSMSD